MTSKQHHNKLSTSEIDLFDKIKSADVEGVRKCLANQQTRKNININCVNESGYTPLYVAIGRGKITDIIKIIRLLIKYGAQINIRNSDGRPLLYYACTILYHRNAHRSFSETSDVINVLLQNGAEPNIRAEANDENTPLHISSFSNNIAAVKSLLLHGADVNCLTKHGDTPLMIACRVSHTHVVKNLLENGASLNLQNGGGSGLTALHIACQNKNHSIVKRILRHGADPNIRTSHGVTAMHFACRFRFKETIRILLEYNADANCQDNDGDTPLHNLLEHFYEDDKTLNCVQALLQPNVNINIKNKKGKTPLLCATAAHTIYHPPVEKLAVIDLLLMFGADVNVQYRAVGVFGGVTGDTVLHYAAKKCHKELVQIILNYNPDLQIFNNDKQTALDLAKEHGNNDIIKCIEDHLHKIRRQMYTYYRETWCHHLSESTSNMKSISPVKTRKRKRRQHS